jgi:hypothetical protein
VEFGLKSLKGKHPSENQSIDERIILKSILGNGIGDMH